MKYTASYGANEDPYDFTAPTDSAALHKAYSRANELNLELEYLIQTTAHRTVFSVREKVAR